jgi:hypothetical protein
LPLCDVEAKLVELINLPVFFNHNISFRNIPGWFKDISGRLLKMHRCVQEGSVSGDYGIVDNRGKARKGTFSDEEPE